MSDEENKNMEDDKIMKGGAGPAAPAVAAPLVPLVIVPATIPIADRTAAANYPRLGADPNPLNQNLLEIINDGIDNIVYQLKKD